MAFTTRQSLLLRICKGDEISWDDFYNTYKPLILLRGGDFFLTQTEKEELVQHVTIAFFNTSTYFKYDSSKGRFRDYLKTIINHKAIDIKRKRRNNEISLEECSCDMHDNSNLDSRWDEEWQQYLLSQAIEELKNRIEPTTFQAFELYALQNEPPQKVAEYLDISVNSVYVYKKRALDEIRKIIQELNE